MTNSSKRLGLFLGFIGMGLFAGTLPATRLAVSGVDPLFLTVARAALADEMKHWENITSAVKIDIAQ